MTELASDGLLRLLIGEEGRAAIDIKQILMGYHKHSERDAEKVMQSALDRGILKLGDKLKLFPSDETTEFQKIKKTRERIELDMKALYVELESVQAKCTHQGDLTYKYQGSSGNWDRNDDCYWIEWRCQDCGKRWTTSQDDSWNLTNKVYPNSRRIRD